MMQPEVSDLTGSFEALLAESISELTTEFRNHDVADLLALIRLDRMATLQSLLDGECELFFEPGTMQFSGHAEAIVGWRAPPSVRLAMSFRGHGVELYYRLTLEAADAHVQLDLIRFEPPEVSPDGRRCRLATALGAARVNRHSRQAGQLQARDVGYQGG
jgi:hypothetical protein